MGRGRRGPSAQTLERMAMPQSNPFGYYIPLVGGVFDISTCHPAYSDNRITNQMITAMTDEIQNNPEFNANPCLLFVLPMILFALATPIRIIFMGTATGWFVWGGMMILSVALFIYGCIRAHEIGKRKLQIIQETIQKHLLTTFADVQPIVIRMSPFNTYMAIEFAWKGLSTPVYQMPQLPPGFAQSQPVHQGMPPGNAPNFNPNPHGDYAAFPQEPALL